MMDTYNSCDRHMLIRWWPHICQIMVIYWSDDDHILVRWWPHFGQMMTTYMSDDDHILVILCLLYDWSDDDHIYMSDGDHVLIRWQSATHCRHYLTDMCKSSDQYTFTVWLDSDSISPAYSVIGQWEYFPAYCVIGQWQYFPCLLCNWTVTVFSLLTV